MSQMMPRIPGRSHVGRRWRYDPNYNGRAVRLNAALKVALSDSPLLKFWEHEFVDFSGLKFERYGKLFAHEDGVHLNNYGNEKLYRSIRDCLRLFKPRA